VTPILTQPERTRVVDLVASLYDFVQPRDRRVFIQEAAGLGRFLPGFDLTGAPRTVAGDLVGRLERYGYLHPDRPNYHALGALFDAILHLNEIPLEDQTFLARLIVHYALIADTPYLNALRERYGIDEKLPSESLSSEAANAVPRPLPGPSFEPLVANQEALERVINSEDNFLDMHLLSGALYCAQAVGRIEIGGEARGTGFLIGPDLVLTNQHVLPKEEHLEEVVVRFGYVNDTSGVPNRGTEARLVPDFYFSSPAENLDFSLVRLKEKPLGEIATKEELTTKSMAELARLGKHRGYLVLTPRTPIEQARVNILQHPNGDPLKVVLTQNYVVKCGATRVQYVADTKDGSSGSPVFNQRWELVALHHSGAPYPAEGLGETLKKTWKGRFRVNEGIPMRAILEEFKAQKIDRYLPTE
jgi:V8-like Glu-specific endopeptidase